MPIDLLFLIEKCCIIPTDKMGMKISVYRTNLENIPSNLNNNNAAIENTKKRSYTLSKFDCLFLKNRNSKLKPSKRTSLIKELDDDLSKVE